MAFSINITMTTALVWIRRDLRLDDNAALAAATSAHSKVYVVFNFDPTILDPLRTLTNGHDKRVHFIAESLHELNQQLIALKAELLITYGAPQRIVPEVLADVGAGALYVNEDYEDYALKRDNAIFAICKQRNLGVFSFKDHLLHAPRDILKEDGSPFVVFTPYYRKWRSTLERDGAPSLFVSDLSKIQKFRKYACPGSVGDILKIAGFYADKPRLSGGRQAAVQRMNTFLDRLDGYAEFRDYPAIDATSLLSVYTRHGCVSVRELIQNALESGSSSAEKWISEIAWREFYYAIAFHFPHIKNRAFKDKYSHLKYENNPDHIVAWKEERTGFPLVDAAMRCLNATGLMHNRLRMICASVLCKTLLVDWRIGECYFAEKLLDFDFACNNGGWQWTAGVGVDAAPYFRIFNPFTQSKKFDANGDYIRSWVPELAHLDDKSIHNPYEKHPGRTDLTYPKLIVDYKKSREDALMLYKEDIY